jgi:hypothetical protein
LPGPRRVAKSEASCSAEEAEAFVAVLNGDDKEDDEDGKKDEG